MGRGAIRPPPTSSSYRARACPSTAPVVPIRPRSPGSSLRDGWVWALEDGELAPKRQAAGEEATTTVAQVASVARQGKHGWSPCATPEASLHKP